VQTPPAIVLSHGPGGLGAVRALARRGVEVVAIAYEATDLVLHSRWPARRLLLAGATDAAKEAALLSLLQELPCAGAAILATSDRLVTFLARYREALGGKYRFRLPPAEMLDALNDKQKETRLAESLGFDIPKTVTTLPSRPEDLEAALQYPIIFKPKSFEVEALFPRKNAVVGEPAELRAFYREWHQALPALLAQEVIPGPDSYSWICSCTFDEDHTLLDCGIKQKLRALPAHFGGSTFAVSRGNAEILELARRLGQRLRYVGHAGIEFRWDARDGTYKYIELNPRLPANVGFDEACGLPTVWNSYRVALEGRAELSGLTQRSGTYYLDLKGDFRSQRHDRVPIWRIVLGYAAVLVRRRTNGPHFAWDDPMPGLVVAARFLGSAWESLRRSS